jgi:hypothetical protein
MFEQRHQHDSSSLRLHRLKDIVQTNGRLSLVFEFVDKDLRRYMESTTDNLDPRLIKVPIPMHTSVNNALS